MRHSQPLTGFLLLCALLIVDVPSALAVQESKVTVKTAQENDANEAQGNSKQEKAQKKDPRKRRKSKKKTSEEKTPKKEKAEEPRSTNTEATKAAVKPAAQEKVESHNATTQATMESLAAAIKQLTDEVKQLREDKGRAAPTQAKEPQSTKADDEPGTTEAKPGGVQVPASWLKEIDWRELGPSNMAGRIIDVEVNRKDPSTWWIATAGGGLLKTSNQGTTVSHQFDREAVVSIGAIASDPTNKEVIWVGTGEANPRNSVSYGNGVYKSTDGGKTFTHLGLDETYQVGRILIDPSNPDTVYVGAAGRLYGTNKERGVYKTTDGGKTWEHVLHKDDRAGVIDMVMHPEDPNTIIVALWDRLRDGFDAWPGDVPKPDGIDGYDPIRKWGPNGGLYKTTDGGKSWKKLSKGLPSGMTGRIGLDWQLKSPHTLFAIIDCEDIGKGPKPFSAYLGLVGSNRDVQAVVTQVMPDSPAAKAKVQIGDVLQKIGDADVQDFDQLLDTLRDKGTKDKISLKLKRGEETVDVEIQLTARPGARTSNDAIMGINGEDGPSGGALLTTITDGGPSAQAGLVKGDLLTKVNGKTLKDYPALIAEIRSRKPGDQFTSTVVRNGQELEFKVTLGSRSGSGSSTRPYTYSYFGQRPNVQDQQGVDGYKYGGVYKSTDGGESWERVNSLNVRPMYFSVIRVDPSDEKRVYVLGVSQFQSDNGGVTFSSSLGRGVHSDAHDLWIDPNDGRHMLIGSDGGFYVTRDRGANWDHINTAAVGQFYDVTISNHKPYRVFGGLQDNGSWGGPNRSRTGDGTYNTDWFRIGGGDGFICAIDPDDPAQLYYESQNGGMGRVHLTTGERGWIRPRAPRGTQYRWNWKTPFMLSHHNPKIYYTAGNYVFRSYDKGNDIKRISPQVVRTRRGSSTAFDESPINPDLLMVGSDDGALWVSRDGGGEWENIMFPYDETAYADESSESAETVERPARAANRAGSGRGAPTFAFFLERFDADEDGLLQTSEIPERMRPYGKMFDADDNGSINEEEMTQLREFVAALPGDAGGRGSAEESAEVTSSASARAPRTWAAASTTSDSSDEDSSAPAGPDHPLNGEWICNLGGEMAGSGQPPFTLIITKLDDEQFSVEIAATVLNDTTKSSEFDEDTGELSFSFTGPQGKFDFKAKLDDGKLVGNLGSEAMGFEAPFNGEREVVAEASDEPEGPGLEGMVPGPRRVQSIEWSKFERERVYIVLDGHYYDDDEPYVFVSEDAGKTWSSLRGNLPTGCSRVLREDMVNRNVLYLGTEFGLWVSVDRGASWTKFHNDLPTVSIHEVAQHESNGEIVVGTHGRGAWAIDVTPLQQMNAAARNAGVHLYTPNTVVQWRFAPERGRGAHGWFTGENPSRSASIYYSLGESASDLKIEVFDIAGRLVRTPDIPDGGTQAGLHKIDWDLRRAPPANSQRQRFRRGAMVGAGSYRLVLTSGDVIVSRVFDVVNDPTEPDVDFDFDGFFEGLEVEDEGVLDHEEAGVFD